MTCLISVGRSGKYCCLEAPKTGGELRHLREVQQRGYEWIIALGDLIRDNKLVEAGQTKNAGFALFDEIGRIQNEMRMPCLTSLPEVINTDDCPDDRFVDIYPIAIGEDYIRLEFEMTADMAGQLCVYPVSDPSSITYTAGDTSGNFGGPGNPHRQLLSNLVPGTEYFVVVRTQDANGNWEVISCPTSFSTLASQEHEVIVGGQGPYEILSLGLWVQREFDVRIETVLTAEVSMFTKYGSDPYNLAQRTSGEDSFLDRHIQTVPLLPGNCTYVQSCTVNVDGVECFSDVIRVCNNWVETTEPEPGTNPDLPDSKKAGGGWMIGSLGVRKNVKLGNNRLANNQAQLVEAIDDCPVAAFSTQFRALTQNDINNRATYAECKAAGLAPGPCSFTRSSVYTKGNPLYKGEIRAAIMGSNGYLEPDMSAGGLLASEAGSTHYNLNLQNHWYEHVMQVPFQPTIGQKYFLVWRNMDPMPNPTGTLTVAQALVEQANNPTRGAMSLNGNFIGNLVGDDIDISPQHSGHCEYTLFSQTWGSWTQGNYANHNGFYELIGPAGERRGNVYADWERSYSAQGNYVYGDERPRYANGSRRVRQTFTAQCDGDFDRVWILHSHHQDIAISGQAATVTVRDAAGNALATGTLPAMPQVSAKNLINNTGSTTWNERFYQEWNFATLSNPVTVALNQLLSIEVSAPEGAWFGFFSETSDRQGVGNLFSMDSGRAEVSNDNGGTWEAFTRLRTPLHTANSGSTTSDLGMRLVRVGLPDRL